MNDSVLSEIKWRIKELEGRAQEYTHRVITLSSQVYVLILTGWAILYTTSSVGVTCAAKWAFLTLGLGLCFNVFIYVFLLQLTAVGMKEWEAMHFLLSIRKEKEYLEKTQSYSKKLTQSNIVMTYMRWGGFLFFSATLLFNVFIIFNTLK